MGMDYKTIFSKEGYGNHGAFGLKILVASSPVVDFDQEAIRHAAYNAADLIEAEVGAARIAVNDEAQQSARNERAELVDLFEEPIFIEEIPNGYCSQWCCRHLPWFVVTTRIGRITIGWRKRVISIDWKGSRAVKTAEELFPGEDTTKSGQSIHAWGYEKVKQYISTVIGSVQFDQQTVRITPTP